MLVSLSNIPTHEMMLMRDGVGRGRWSGCLLQMRAVPPPPPQPVRATPIGGAGQQAVGRGTARASRRAPVKYVPLDTP